MRFPSAAAGTAGLLLASLATGDAAAHVTANPDHAEADSWFRTALRVSHGCEGTPTIAVRVNMPDGVLSVRPQMKPGWEISITTRKLDVPIEGPHGTVNEVVDEVAWRGGPLPDACVTVQCCFFRSETDEKSSKAMTDCSYARLLR